jgi:predicted tellurium resistance membrane protein TerC
MPPLLTSNAALGVAFALIVLLLLALDLGLFRRTPRDPTFRQSALWTAAWLGLAVAFGLGVTARMGPDAGLAFASAYLVEQSLSVDNMLVAVLGVTADPFLALSSNLFAVLGLRSLFFLVQGLLARLRYLQVGLVLILLFIGAKMLLSFAVEIPVAASLLVITTILGGAVVASLRTPTAERPQHEQA